MNRFSSPVLGVVLVVASTFAHAKNDPAHFQFRLPHSAAYQVEESEMRSAEATSRPQRLKASAAGSTNQVEFTSLLVVQLESSTDLQPFISGRGLKLARTVAPQIFILEADDALISAREAHRLSSLPGVKASYPVMSRQMVLDGPYAGPPTDSFFGFQWQLERRNGDGSKSGMDLNVRAAWPYSTGQGITLAVADCGVELTHVELASRAAGAPHYNFVTETNSGGPFDNSPSGAHGTEVAGLAVAALNNARMAGVAPGASLASWIIFQTNFSTVTDDKLMEMYQYQSNVVSVQNHSWGSGSISLNGPTLLEQVGISNAVTFGRNGRGVVMVRSAGNGRTSGGNVNDDGYASDPRVISVAAVRFDGRVASYSEPGAPLLVGAASGDPAGSFTGLLSTDLIGLDRGANQIGFFPPNQDLSDYVFDNFGGFTGTSAGAPQISGIVALVLGANTNLSYRDVQQILALSARHFDFADPDLRTNGAGFLVSHYDGFGVPDAGVAVNLARTWPTRLEQTNVVHTTTDPTAIPDDGLRVLVTGPGVPFNLASIRTLPSVGPHADDPTPQLPLVDFGFGTNSTGFNLTNKGALIQRSTATFASTITLAAQLGAAFAVVYNYSSNTSLPGAPGGEQLIPMGGTDSVPVPAVFIGHSDGEALKALFQTNNAALAQIHLNSTSIVFNVTETLMCEHVGLRVISDHPLRGDVRITLVSPSGVRSVLQRYNADVTPGPVDWTYYSTHHFFESSAGTWTAYFSDEYIGAEGSVYLVSLDLSGVAIYDTDADALDDVWELGYFGDLNQGPRTDPDRDGYSNAREQLMGTPPNLPGQRFPLDLSRWNQTLARLSWPGSPHYTYEIRAGTNVASLNVVTNIPGSWPETEWFTPYKTVDRQFFSVRAIPIP